MRTRPRQHSSQRAQNPTDEPLLSRYAVQASFQAWVPSSLSSSCRFVPDAVAGVVVVAAAVGIFLLFRVMMKNTHTFFRFIFDDEFDDGVTHPKRQGIPTNAIEALMRDTQTQARSPEPQYHQMPA